MVSNKSLGIIALADVDSIILTEYHFHPIVNTS